VQHEFVPAGPAGVLDFFESVYREEDHAAYASQMPASYETKSDGTPRTDAEKQKYFKTYWRTYQMSDHLPMWVDLLIDYTDDYLDGLSPA
jgi:hypothetical protein